MRIVVPCLEIVIIFSSYWISRPPLAVQELDWRHKQENVEHVTFILKTNLQSSLSKFTWKKLPDSQTSQMYLHIFNYIL